MLTHEKHTLIKWRRGLAAEWTTENPILSGGEPGYEIDTGKFKIGDGYKRWADLHYFLDGVVIQQIIDNAVIDGVPGSSAYEVALQNGFVGTESAWLASLHGAAGTNGESAYQIAVDNGFSGTQSEWLASLHGTNGTNGTSYTGPKITASSSAPSSPTTGDIWIDLSS